MEYKVCDSCGSNHNIELHHIIFRSHASYMSNIKINFKYLCGECHRGSNGPHRNRDVDIKYKLELQKRIFELFEDKEYYTQKQIKDKLDCSSNEMNKIVKKLLLHKEGYNKLDIIIRLMGNRLYAV